MGKESACICLIASAIMIISLVMSQLTRPQMNIVLRGRLLITPGGLQSTEPSYNLEEDSPVNANGVSDMMEP